MTMIRIAVAAGAILALAGCVTDDAYYGGYGDGYRTSHYDDDYRTGTGGSYGDRYRGYDSAYDPYRRYDRGYDYAYNNRDGIGECDLPGENIRTTREDCRRLQRRYGRTIEEAEEMRRDRYRYYR